MELVTKKRLHLVSGRANLPLAEEIGERLGVSLGDAHLGDFANGELHCRFGESVVHPCTVGLSRRTPVAGTPPRRRRRSAS